VPLAVNFTNAGDTPWADAATANPKLKDGSYAVRVTHAWVPQGDVRDARVGAVRTDLPRPMMPGDTMNVPLTLRTPTEPGEYTLVIELVQELVQWFADGGADRLTLPVRVVRAGQAPGDTPVSPSGPPPIAPARR
jgi:hypothetical protein